MGKMKSRDEFGSVINKSINEVLSRTLITSLTTLLALAALLALGGEVLFEFSLALFIGVLIGTYSSVFVASPLVYLWRKRAA
jgi:preprotein translocase subunit SecF